jgi:LysM repeat protein
MHITRRQFTRSALFASAGGLLLPPSLRAQAATYTVRKGDTLGHIALGLNVSTSELKRANHLTSDLIKVGQKLTIPAGGNTSIATPAPTPTSTYTVVRGDTLGSIAMRNSISVRDLKRANNLTRDLIRVGQTLQIPGGRPSQDLLAHVRAETARINVRRDNWKRIVVHHSAIKYGNAKKYDAAHRQRGMQNGLAYHFLIGNGIDSGDGEIEVGPRWKKQLLGGHVKSYNLNLTAIGICLVGNFEQTHPSQKQLDAFTQLMDWLQGDVLKKKTQFAGHKELKGEQTICPGKNFPLAAMHARYD